MSQDPTNPYTPPKQAKETEPQRKGLIYSWPARALVFTAPTTFTVIILLLQTEDSNAAAYTFILLTAISFTITS